MNKKALIGLSVALLLPLACYLLLRYASDDAVNMPRKYFMDSTVERVVNGKTLVDTVWHPTANLHLRNQLGDSVGIFDKPGKIVVVDMFFTRCGSICPKLTYNMSKLQQSFLRGGDLRKKVDTSIVQFVSLSIDPSHDSVNVLKRYADQYHVNHDSWWMLTGNRDSIYNFIFQELKVDKYSDEPISPDFIHTGKFVLIDKERVVRGFYNGLDSSEISKLARDIGLLMLEKDKKKKSEVFSQILDLSWLWFVIIILVVFFMIYLRSRRKVNG